MIYLTFGSPIRTTRPPFLQGKCSVDVSCVKRGRGREEGVEANLSREKQLLTIVVAPVASTSLPTPSPPVSLITGTVCGRVIR